MNFDYEKVFISLMEFFSILLPGAMLTFLPMDEVVPIVLGDGNGKLAGMDVWAVFVFVGYLFGRLLFLLALWLDRIYDWFRNRTTSRQAAEIAGRGRFWCWSRRVFVAAVLRRQRNLTVDRAVKFNEHALSRLQARHEIDGFHSCKALLNAERSKALKARRSMP